MLRLVNPAGNVYREAADEREAERYLRQGYHIVPPAPAEAEIPTFIIENEEE
ncbi:MAG: hypothetical protein J6K98_02520 [Clostridia bacterium]|nr:hypothetical protein [Clostridia bacterium]